MPKDFLDAATHVLYDINCMSGRYAQGDTTFALLDWARHLYLIPSYALSTPIALYSAKENDRLVTKDGSV